MPRVLLRMPADVYREIQSHLFPACSEGEQVGFIFARRSLSAAEVLEFLEWHPIRADGFVVRSDYHLELTDEARAAVIKRAHDLDASIVEFHAHEGPRPACFSPTDLRGLQEFVPHVWWRLKGKPYLAIVMTRKDFDGLAWVVDPRASQRLDGIEIEGRVHQPTRLSPLRYDNDER